jgi:dephospho-CoA kinase
MKTLGVTGGIGSGKTTVCRIFEDLGARVFYADAEAKQLMHTDAEARAEIIAAFGEDSYDPEGQLNRAYLAREVFGDAEQLARINAIVHPRVFRAFERAIQQAEQDGVALLVHESALIFEVGVQDLLDAIAVVDAPADQRIARVTARDKVTPAQVQARIENQLPTAELRRRADYIIDNTGTVDDLRTQVEAVYRDVLESEN